MNAGADVFDAHLEHLPAAGSSEDARAAWRAAADEARLAYLAWCEAGRSHARMAYAVYRAASDREAVAADVLARCD
jgi:hypothetical protein